MSPNTRHATMPASPAPNWDHAACTQDTAELFFPVGDTPAARRQADRAKLICARCPIRDDCLTWALDTRQDQGVWGGLTEKERRTVHRRRSTTEWARTRHVAERMYRERLPEVMQLVDRGLSPVQMAAALETNVQTVNRVLERINTAQEEVKAA